MGETTSPAETCIVLLGGFSVSVAGQPIADRWRLRKAKTLVKLLALAPGHRLHRDIVVDLLWPEAEPQATANNLHQLVAVDGPDPIGSAAYATDFNEVLHLGSQASTERTAAQTETAKFFSANIVLQLRQALLLRLESHPLSLVRTARLFAALDAATADSLIRRGDLSTTLASGARSRPSQPAGTDGNDATAADPTWGPLLEPAIPPHPDYLSGHTVVVAAFTATVGPCSAKTCR